MKKSFALKLTPLLTYLCHSGVKYQQITTNRKGKSSACDTLSSLRNREFCKLNDVFYSPHGCKGLKVSKTISRLTEIFGWISIASFALPKWVSAFFVLQKPLHCYSQTVDDLQPAVCPSSLSPQTPKRLPWQPKIKLPGQQTQIIAPFFR